MRPLALALALLPCWPSPLGAQDAVDAARLRRAVASFADEPRVDEVVGWARAASTTDPAAASDALDRARWSALLPQLRVGVTRGLGWDWAARQTATSDTASLTGGEDLSLVGSLVFQLDRLLAPGEESGLLRERRSLEEGRFELASRVIALYFERRRLQVEAELTGTVELGAAMRIAELTALLDALTGGRFSAALPE
jgi:hypothetical protein